MRDELGQGRVVFILQQYYSLLDYVLCLFPTCCLDINECSFPVLNNCSRGVSICVNIPGSYTCPCITGYKLSSQGHCQGKTVLKCM